MNLCRINLALIFCDFRVVRIFEVRCHDYCLKPGVLECEEDDNPHKPKRYLALKVHCLQALCSRLNIFPSFMLFVITLQMTSILPDVLQLDLI